MKIKTLVALVLILGFILSLGTSPAIATKKRENQGQEAIYIPKEVKKVFQEGIQTRQARLEIPFTIIKHFYIPSRENLHSIFIFKIKNADLGFTPIASGPESLKQKKKDEKTLPSESEIPPPKLQTKSHIFLQFNRLENDEPGELVKEVYVPVRLEAEGASYDPDKEEIYMIGYPLPPGNYLLSMAIAYAKLEKIGTQYFEFSLLGEASVSERIETTPLFFVKSFKEMASAETTTEIHKGFFTWSVLQIEPNVDNLLSSGENLDILFYIMGAKPSEDGKYIIEVNYEVLKGEEKVIRYALAAYDAPLVSQPLPLKRTFVIKSKEGEERKEMRDLEPGKYTLSLTITDKVSENRIIKSIDFEVKE